MQNNQATEVTARPVLSVRPTEGGYMVTLDVQADDFESGVTDELLDAITGWLNSNPGGFFVARR